MIVLDVVLRGLPLAGQVVIFGHGLVPRVCRDPGDREYLCSQFDQYWLVLQAARCVPARMSCGLRVVMLGVSQAEDRCLGAFEGRSCNGMTQLDHRLPIMLFEAVSRQWA